MRRFSGKTIIVPGLAVAMAIGVTICWYSDARKIVYHRAVLLPFPPPSKPNSVPGYFSMEGISWLKLQYMLSRQSGTFDQRRERTLQHLNALVNLGYLVKREAIINGNVDTDGNLRGHIQQTLPSILSKLSPPAGMEHEVLSNDSTKYVIYSTVTHSADWQQFFENINRWLLKERKSSGNSVPPAL